MPAKYKNILILTGAGISAESGLSTFRSAGGLWNNHRVEDVASIEGFERNPALVHDFYNNLKTEIAKAKPNAAHLAITKLQRQYPGTVSVVTQNVDTLHEKAGNQNVFHIHGQVNQAVCLNCGHILETWGDVDTETVCPHCGHHGHDETEYRLLRRKSALYGQGRRTAAPMRLICFRGHLRRCLSGLPASCKRPNTTERRPWSSRLNLPPTTLV